MNVHVPPGSISSPFACRAMSARVYALAHAQGQSVSVLVKGLIRTILATQPTNSPDVHMAVNRLSDPPSLPALLVAFLHQPCACVRRRHGSCRTKSLAISLSLR